uniref:Zinc finger protein 143 n=1 Tax=Lygus hesperus TaxID=30085 RepID=A0A146KU29_LYGHE
MNSIDGEVETILLPADVEIVNLEGCEETDGFSESQTVITTVEQVDWTNIQLTVDPSVTEEYLEESEDDPIALHSIALENDIDESSLQTEEYPTQYVLVEDDGEEVDEDGSQQETPFLLFEDGTVTCIDQDLVLLLQPDEEEEITTIDGVEYKRTREKKRLKSHVCKYDGCTRAYSSPHHLKVHERNHTNDRPYKCTFQSCNKKFNTDYSRKTHVRTHTGEKPYVCSFDCGKGFKTSGDLAKHIRTHTGERPFVCPLEGCEKSFVTSNACKVHLRIHTGEKPYVCQAEGCERGFSSPTNFKNHMRIHTGEKPYSCSVVGCNKKFTEYSSLYKHRLVHSPVKHYPCNFCSKVYRQLSSLSTHKRTVHGVVVSADGSELLLEQIISSLGSPS